MITNDKRPGPRRIWSFAFAAFLAVGCGSQTEPVSEYHDLSGQWEGTITSTDYPPHIVGTVTATVTQEADDSLWSGTLEIDGELVDEDIRWPYEESFSIGGTVSKGEDPKISFSLRSLQCSDNVWGYAGEYRSADETLATTATGEQKFWDPNYPCTPASHVTPTIKMSKERE